MQKESQLRSSAFMARRKTTGCDSGTGGGRTLVPNNVKHSRDYGRCARWLMRNFAAYGQNLFIMNTKTIATAALTALAITANSQNMSNPNTDTSLAPQEQLQLTQEWDKTFPRSESVV